MSISSLHDLISQFKGNYNLQQPKSNPNAKNVSTKAVKSNASSGTALSQDKVTLSSQARDYLKANTLPSGKFLKPNVFNDLLSALETPSDQNDPQSTTRGQSSLLDFLSAYRQ